MKLFPLLKRSFIDSIEKKKRPGAGIILYTAWYAIFSIILVTVTQLFRTRAFLTAGMIFLDLLQVLFLIVVALIGLPVTIYPFLLLRDPQIRGLLKNDFKDLKKSSSKNKLLLVLFESFIWVAAFLFTLIALNNFYLTFL
ncbi:MAG: hypothetical protein ACFFE8_17270 [Candidatus Heimdallarchaeota archaeon]